MRAGEIARPDAAPLRPRRRRRARAAPRSTLSTPAARSAACSGGRRRGPSSASAPPSAHRMRERSRLRLPRPGPGRISCRRSFRAQRLLAQRGDDLAGDGNRDLGRAHRADVEADRRMDARERRLVETFGAHALEPLGVGLCASRARRCRNIRRAARGPARGRRSWDRASAGRSRCSGRAARASSASSGHCASTGASGKRSGVAKAVRGSMIDGIEPGDARDRRQRLRNMHRADHHQPHRAEPGR